MHETAIEAGRPAARADSLRNRDRILTVAADVFVKEGVNASLRSIARQAHVGIGTLYRRFGTREGLLAALLEDQFALLSARADELDGADDPADAFDAWIRSFADACRIFPGIPGTLLDALADTKSELHRSCRRLAAAGKRLMNTAQQAGAVRDDLTIGELFALIAGATWASEQSPSAKVLNKRLISVVVEGLRPR